MIDGETVGGLAVRAVRPTDAGAWLRLREALWPGSPHDHGVEIETYFADPPEREACFVAELEGVGLVGFAEVGLRLSAEACRSSPVGYLEGILVEPVHRAAGVGRALVEAGERWARERGCTEMASDREVSNAASGAFHEAVGYEETVRIVCYRKSLVAEGVAQAPPNPSVRPPRSSGAAESAR